MKEVENKYLMYYSKLGNKKENAPVVCHDGFTGWHIIREMTPEFFKEFNLKTIESNINGNDYFALDDDGDVCNRDRCSEWFEANSWFEPNKHLNELKRKDDIKGSLGWYTKTPLMNETEFRSYLVATYSEKNATKWDKMNNMLHKIGAYNSKQYKVHQNEFMNLNEADRKALEEKIYKQPKFPQLFIDREGFLRDKFYNIVIL